MDVFKLAFETTIAGLFAFLWLGAAIDLLCPTSLSRIRSTLVEQNQTLMAAGLLSVAYCLGSAILPISNQLVNDEHWPLPEDTIRCRVLVKESDLLSGIGRPARSKAGADVDRQVCGCSYFDRFGGSQEQIPEYPVTHDASVVSYYGAQAKLYRENRDQADLEVSRDQILTLFQLQEAQMLNQRSDEAESFRQLRERIVVLRGAVFSGFVLLLICVFAYIAPPQDEPFSFGRRLPGLVLACILMLFAAYNAYKDIVNHNIFDIPVLEAILAVIAAFGIFLVMRGVRPRPFLTLRVVAVIGLCAAFVYGGWLWSEIIYDQQIINSVAVMESAAGKAITNPAKSPADAPSPIERESALYDRQQMP